MANLRKALAAGLLNGLGTGLDTASNVYQDEYKTNRDFASDMRKLQAQEAMQKSNLEREYDFIEQLPDEDAQDRALKLKSAGNLTLDPKSGKFMKYKNSGGGKGKGGSGGLKIDPFTGLPIK